jgi:transcription initiation factor TFIID subunit 2
MLQENEDDVAEREASQEFQNEALEEIERYLKRDEWTNSYHNVWTVAGLDAKQKLMKAGMIPVKPLAFLKYLQDMTHEEVRIKCWEALVDLGQLLDKNIFQFFMVCLSTDRSSYVRDRLMKILCQGLASIAIGEYEPEPTAEVPLPDAAEADADADEDGDGEIQLLEGKGAADADPLQIIGNEKTAEVSEKQKLLQERRNDLPTALTWLKKDMEEKYEDLAPVFKEAVWKAIDSPYMGRAERITLVELCATMFGEADHFFITLLFPKKWEVTRSVHNQGKRVSSLPFMRRRVA